MSVVINGSGSITGISAGGLPDATITQAEIGTNVAGTGPAFSAYMGSNQTVSSGVWTKLVFNTEEFDTNSNYDPSTNYRFTPTVAGYYSVIVSGNPYSSAKPVRSILRLYKNGSVAKVIWDLNLEAAAGYTNGMNGSALIYMNGSTDYIEAYGYMTVASGSAIWQGAAVEVSQFSAFLARAA